MNDLLADFVTRYGEPMLADGALLSPYLSHAKDRIAAKRSARMPAVNGSVAVLPIQGVMTPKGSWFGPGTQEIGRAFDFAVNDSRIGGIVFDMDTPGGMSWGTPELADKVYSARGSKPVVAVANHMAASAGLYVGSAADRFVVAPSGHVGSLGVYRYHVDQSQAMAAEGIKVTFIHAAPYKVEGNPFEPLSADAQANWQSEVNDLYGEFLAAVAKHRNASVKSVRDNYGQGRTLTAKKAAEVGMVDRLATIDRVIAEMLPAAGKASGGRTRAEELTAGLLAAWNGEGVSVEAVEGDDPGVPSDDLRRRRERRNREAVA